MSGAFIRTSVFQFIGYFRICLVCLNTLSEISTFLEKKDEINQKEAKVRNTDFFVFIIWQVLLFLFLSKAFTVTSFMRQKIKRSRSYFDQNNIRRNHCENVKALN